MAAVVNAQSHLECLSDEIIQMIFECIAKERDGSTAIRKHPATKTLLSIALYSRRLNSLVQAALYRNIDDLPFIGRSLFLQARALYPKSLHASAQQNTFGTSTTCIAQGNWNHIGAEVTKGAASSEDATVWYGSTQTGEWDGWIALILSQLPNLETLTITEWRARVSNHPVPYPCLEKFLARVAVLQDIGPYLRAFSRLQTVTIQSGRPTLRDVMRFLRIKSVLNFHGSRVIYDSSYEDEDELENDPTELKTTKLNLIASTFGSQSFFDFLRHFTSLKHLVYEYRRGENHPLKKHSELFMYALSYSQTTLETLQLRGHYFKNFIICSLAGFSNLRSVAVNILALGSTLFDNPPYIPAEERTDLHNYFKDLPQNLESLTLTGRVRGSYLEGLVRMLNSIPSLKFLDIGWVKTKFPDKPSPKVPDYHEDFTAEQAQILWDSCLLAGVEMKLKYWAPKPKYVSWPRPKCAEVIRWPVLWVDCRKVIVRFDYPWEGYEDCLKEHGYGADYKFAFKGSYEYMSFGTLLC